MTPEKTPAAAGVRKRRPPRTQTRRAFLVAGMLFGDEGKGSMTDWLVREHNATMVVRYNGGPQAAHNVVDVDGRHHTFAQWGAGTFVPGVRTYLSRYMLINPLNMMAEEYHLRELGIGDAWDRLVVDERCVVITPWHRGLGRIREIVRSDRHGSCGEGINEAVRDLFRGEAITACDLVKPQGDLEERLEAVRVRLYAEALDLLTGILIPPIERWEWQTDGSLSLALRELADPESSGLAALSYRTVGERITLGTADVLDDVVVFEGAQGVLLDECLGYQPYVTWGRTTFANAAQMVAGAGYDVSRVGVMRAFATRHGPGPFVGEASDEVFLRIAIEHDHNGHGEWQGTFRMGWVDLGELERVADFVGPLDVLAVTCLDRCDRDRVAVRGIPGRQPVTWVPTDAAVELYAETLGARGIVLSRGVTANDKETIR